MAVSYKEIIRQVGHHLNALLADGGPAQAESVYAGSTFGTTEFNDPRFPPTAVKDAIIAMEGDIVLQIANSGNQEWRSLYLSTTPTLAPGDMIPPTDVNGLPILGQLGAAKDASGLQDEFQLESGDFLDLENSILGVMLMEDSGASPTALTPLSAISFSRYRRLKRNVANHLAELEFYATNDRIVYHLRDRIVFYVCVYDHAAQLASITASLNNPTIIPDALVPALVSGAVAKLAAGEAGLKDLAALHSQYYQTITARIVSGGSVDSVTVPTPVNQR